MAQRSPTRGTLQHSGTLESPQGDDFLLSLPQLLARRTFKWGQYPSGVIAACVADMDFCVAPQIRAAIQHGVDTFDYGYPLREGRRADRAVAAAFVARMKSLCGWDVNAAQVLVLADLVQAIYATILAFSDSDDGVILQVPNYPPFREAIQATGRRLIPLEMESTAEGHLFDLDKLKRNFDPRTRLLILCNPQNPSGRVFTRIELEKVAAFADKHDLTIISDEIHSDLVYSPAQHLPVASLSPTAAARTVTLNSATKSFNLPGLRCAIAYFGTETLMQRYHARIPDRLTGSVNNFGIDATVAAWTHGQPWLDAVRSHLLNMRQHVTQTLRRELPTIRFHVPEATYLLWLDCTALRLEEPAFDFFLKHARIGFSPGRAFHPDASQFVRMNFATSKALIDEMLERMIAAVRSRR